MARIRTGLQEPVEREGHIPSLYPGQLFVAHSMAFVMTPLRNEPAKVPVSQPLGWASQGNGTLLVQKHQLAEEESMAAHEQWGGTHPVPEAGSSQGAGGARSSRSARCSSARQSARASLPLASIREGSVLNGGSVYPEQRRPMQAVRDLAVRSSAWLTSERCGMLPQGHTYVVLEEVQLALGMGKRVVRSLVGSGGDDNGGPPRSPRALGWITSFKNGTANLVEQGKAHAVALAVTGSGGEIQGTPSDRTLRRPSNSSSISTWRAGWDRADMATDMDSRAARMAKHRLARQRFSREQPKGEARTAIVVASGDGALGRAVE